MADRAQCPVFLRAEWRELAIANYVVDPGLLKPYIPYGTELDTWNGHCYVSLVGFMFQRTRVLGMAIPFHINFPEVNLRFYVRCQEGDQWHRGVVFIQEIVPRAALTFVANTLYKEHYRTMRMEHAWTLGEDGMRVAYHWRKQRWHGLELLADPVPMDMPASSEAEFITEHYRGYTRIDDRRTSCYVVEHPRWRTHAVRRHRVDVDFASVYGDRFGCLTNERPASVMLAEGSPIAVRKSRPLSW